MTFSKTKAGIRLHVRVVVTKELTVPDKHADRSQMEPLIDIDSNAIHLFDRGYNDYNHFDQLCEHDVRFITRLKENAKVEVLSEQDPDLENNIFLDQESKTTFLINAIKSHLIYHLV